MQILITSRNNFYSVRPHKADGEKYNLWQYTLGESSLHKFICTQMYHQFFVTFISSTLPPLSRSNVPVRQPDIGGFLWGQHWTGEGMSGGAIDVSINIVNFSICAIVFGKDGSFQVWCSSLRKMMVKNDLELLFEKGERTTERRINGQIDDDEFLKQKHSTHYFSTIT